jgi:hypothetical protein
MARGEEGGGEESREESGGRSPMGVEGCGLRVAGGGAKAERLRIGGGKWGEEGDDSVQITEYRERQGRGAVDGVRNL